MWIHDNPFMALPGVGLLILASDVRAPELLAFAVALLGLSLGAEIDILGFLVMRFFKVEIFSTVIGLVGAAMALSGAAGSLLLSVTLRLSGVFSAFLFTTAVAAFAGG